MLFYEINSHDLYNYFSLFNNKSIAKQQFLIFTYKKTLITRVYAFIMHYSYSASIDFLIYNLPEN